MVAQEFYQICSVIKLRYCCSNNYLCFQYRDLEKDQAQTCRLTAAKQKTQNVRLTKTLMFASILALVCWLPLLFVSGLRYLGTTRSIRYYFIALILVGLILIIRKVLFFLRIFSV